MSWINIAQAEMRIRPTTAPTTQQVQWQIDLDRQYDNPFDPDEISVNARLSGPNNESYNVPAFWQAGTLAADGHFMVRFAPTKAGRWTIEFTATDRTDTRVVASREFTVDSVSGDGVIGRSPVNPNYFRFANGRSFFPIGINMAWGEHKSLASYEKWLPQFAAAGGNWVRIWMCDPSVMTETKEAGLGRYDQEACEYYDRLLAISQKNNVYCIVTFNNYRDLLERDSWGPCPWKRLPYCAENGGPATRPADFINDPRCQKLCRQRLRYIAARYGSFHSVAVWEFFNEQTYSGVQIPPSWTIDMASYLRSVDPVHHLISTSFGGPAQDEVWRSEQIDLTQTHYYGDENTTDCTTAIQGITASQRMFKKPYLMAETGISAQDGDQKLDVSGIGTNLHNGLWSALASGAAGTTMNWWWDNYVGANNLWNAYSGVAKFSAELDLSNSSFEPLTIETPLKINHDSGPETFTDSVLLAAGGWGKSHGQLITVRPNGLADRALPRYLFGSGHQDLITPTIIDATFAADAEGIVHVSRVSDMAVLRVIIDDEPCRDFLVSALPGASSVKSTTRATSAESNSGPRLYQADVDATFRFPVPKGHHRIELRNLGTDWLMLDSMTLQQTCSSRFAALEVLLMADAKRQNAFAWLHDPQSNWRNDQLGRSSGVVMPAQITLPIKVACDVQWWDTRSGKMIQRDTVNPVGEKLMIITPPITRDVAMIARPAGFTK